MQWAERVRPRGCTGRTAVSCLLCLGVMVKQTTQRPHSLCCSHCGLAWRTPSPTMTTSRWEHGGAEKLGDLPSVTQPGTWQNAAPTRRDSNPIPPAAPSAHLAGWWVHIPHCTASTGPLLGHPHSPVTHAHLPSHGGDSAAMLDAARTARQQRHHLTSSSFLGAALHLEVLNELRKH